MYNYVLIEYSLYKPEYKKLKIKNSVIKINLIYSVQKMLIVNKYSVDKLLVWCVNVIKHIKISILFIDKIVVLLRNKKKQR